jgi:hypothetical protein
MTNQRGLFAGGKLQIDVIEYVTINSLGDGTDFGDLITGGHSMGGTSNGTNERGIFGGGGRLANTNQIDYVTINSAGNASDFGNLTVAKSGLSATSDD